MNLDTHEPESEDPTALIIEAPEKIKDTSTPKAGPPDLGEWQDFIGRVVLKTLTEGYITMMLRDIDLTEREIESVKLTKEDLNDMSAPIASVVNKSKRAKKHGRAIIAMADSYEAMVALVIWMRRVRRIARRHNPVLKEQTIQRDVINNGSAGQNGSEGPSNGYRIYNPGSG